MPFLDDIGPRDERRGPTWASFTTVVDQLERLVAANLVWSLQLVPGLLALAFPEIPAWVRVVMGVYSATALPPATAVLFGLADEACRGRGLDTGLALDLLRRLGTASLRTLAPLYGTFGVLVWAALLLTPRGPTALTTLLTVLLLCWSVCATLWAPLFVTSPGTGAVDLARESALLVWRRPERALGAWLATGVIAVVGLISIAGIFLIVPTLIAVLQTHHVRELRSGRPA